jgi:small subunit ribosomal protein S17
MLSPKRTTYWKTQNGNKRGTANRGRDVSFDDFAVQAREPGRAKSDRNAPAEVGDRHEQRGFLRQLVGRVVSAKTQKAVVVEVVTHRRDLRYGKYECSRARYEAGDQKSELKVGDEVELQEHHPISRQKGWIVTRVLRKTVEGARSSGSDDRTDDRGQVQN